MTIIIWFSKPFKEYLVKYYLCFPAYIILMPVMYSLPRALVMYENMIVKSPKLLEDFEVD